MAGRSMPGMVLRTKRAVAMSAPVLPAETAACALPSLTWLMAMRMEESFLFFQGKLRGFVHADDFGGVEYGNALHRRVGCGEGLADGRFVADHNEVYVLLLFQKGKGTGDGNCET